MQKSGKPREPRVKMPFKTNEYLKSKRFRNINYTLIAEAIRGNQVIERESHYCV